MTDYYIEEAASTIRRIYGYFSVRFVGTDGKGRMLFDCYARPDSTGADLVAVTPRHIA